MPMAGRGSRFSEVGFEMPKPLIPIHGKPFFWWATRSVEKFIPCSGVTFVVLEEHVRTYHIDGEIKKFYPDARIVCLPQVTEGAAVTALRGIEGLDSGTPVLFNDCDHLFQCSEFNRYCETVLESASMQIPEAQAVPNGHSESTAEYDGALLTFESSNPAYSYLQYSESGEITGTIEKCAVSRDAICGAYYFRSRAVFESACAEYLRSCGYKEFFLSGVYNALIASGGKVAGFRTDFHLPFGVPEEYREAGKADNNSLFQSLE